MTDPLTAETFINWMWEYDYQSDSSADHSAFRNRFSRQIARLNEDAHRTAQPRPLTPDAITDEMVERALTVNADLRPKTVHRMLTAALAEPPARPEGADLIDALLFDMGVDEKRDEVANYIAARLNVSPKEDR